MRSTHRHPQIGRKNASTGSSEFATTTCASGLWARKNELVPSPTQGGLPHGRSGYSLARAPVRVDEADRVWCDDRAEVAGRGQACEGGPRGRREEAADAARWSARHLL